MERYSKITKRSEESSGGSNFVSLTNNRSEIQRSQKSVKLSQSENGSSLIELGETCNCIFFQRNLCKKYSILIDLDGRIYKILDSNVYKRNLLKLCSLIMIGFFARIIRGFPFYPVTVVGNTVYSQVVAATLARCHIKYALCKSDHRITYYETDDGQEIPFEGPSPNHFPSKVVSMIPLSTEELIQLEKHTALHNLDKIQNQILESFTRKDDVRIVNTSDIIHQQGNNDSIKSCNYDYHSPVMRIQRFAGNICYVMTYNAIWLTRLVIMDKVSPLQPGEIITGLYGNITPDPADHHSINILDQVFNNRTAIQKYTIVNKQTSCTVIEGETITRFERFPLYHVLSDLTIKSIIHDKEKSHESIIYNLDNPRSFSKDAPIVLIHPFHLPPSWDPFLSIMIITRALIQLLA